MTQAFALRREKHAIGEFSASFQFQGEISQSRFVEVKRKLAEVAERLQLDTPMPIQFVQVGVGTQALGDPPPAAGFQRFAENGEVATSIACDRNSIVFALREYGRWEQVSPVLVDTFAELSPIYMTELKLAHSLRVQYLNEFRAKSSKTKSAASLFQPDTHWIAAHVLRKKELWHCHVGEFRTVSPELRYLINVNSDVNAAQFVGDQEPSLSVKVLILCGCFYDVPKGKPRDLTAVNIREMISADLNAAHKLERDTLKEIISDDYLVLMGADKDDY